MCRDTGKLRSVLELPPSDLLPATPPPPESRPHLTCPSWDPSAELLTCAPPLSGLSGPDCPLLWGAPAPPSPCTCGRATGMFSLIATCRAGHSKGYTKCKIKPNVSCSETRKTFLPSPSSTVSHSTCHGAFFFFCVT